MTILTVCLATVLLVRRWATGASPSPSPSSSPSPTGRGILLKPAPGAKEAEEEEKDVEKGGRGVRSGKTVKNQEDLVKGKANSSSPPLLPLLAAPRDIRIFHHWHFLL